MRLGLVAAITAYAAFAAFGHQSLSAAAAGGAFTPGDVDRIWRLLMVLGLGLLIGLPGQAMCMRLLARNAVSVVSRVAARSAAAGLLVRFVLFPWFGVMALAGAVPATRVLEFSGYRSALTDPDRGRTS
jgi:hypothetical protein